GLALHRCFKLPLKKYGGFPVQFNQRGTLRLFPALVRRSFPSLWQRDAAFFGDRADGLRKFAAIHLHHELENVAARPAAEAVINLLYGMDGERGSLFGMK